MTDSDEGQVTAPRSERLLKEAEEAGLLQGPTSKLFEGRFPEPLVRAAKRVTGLTEPTELLTYALVKVALEDDDYGSRLLARKGAVPRGILTTD
jgi:hypothetical protein